MSQFNEDSNRRKALVGSLVAAGAALAPTALQADVIAIPVNQTVGFGPGYLQSISVPLTGNVSFKLFTGVPLSYQFLYVGAGVSIPRSGFVAQGVNSGAKFPVSAFTYRAIALATALGPSLYGHVGDYPYFLFRFAASVPGGYDYGYGSGTLTFNPPGEFGYTLNALYYDNTGALIPAGAPAMSGGGATPSATPEPASFALAALALGAVAVRKWKQAKAA